MEKYIGDDVGKFKLECTSNKLFYKSSNAYQIGDKIVYSGVGYFARKHTDFFNDKAAIQSGSFIKPIDFTINSSEDIYKKYVELIMVQYK